MKNAQLLTGFLLTLLVLTTLVGCSSKVSKSSYDKIDTGMTMAEVEKLLGKGTEQAGIAGALGDLAGSGKVVKWEDGEKNITVTFVNDKVTAKASSGL